MYEVIRKVINKKFKNRLTILNVENLPKKGPYITACNHVGSLEPFLVTAVVHNHTGQKVYSIAKEWVCKSVGKRLSGKLGLIPVLKGDKSKCLDVAIDKLRVGEIISIFPEGSRKRRKGQTRDDLLKGKTGAVRLAIKAGVPIVPLGYRGPVDNYAFLLYPIKHVFLSRKQAVLKIGKPISFDEYYNKELNKMALDELTRNLMRRIGELSQQKYNY